MIKIQQLKKSYIIGGKPVMILKGIDLEINKGEFVAIMGPSGSGKSTLMNMIGLLDSWTSGSYLFDKKPVDHFSEDEQADFRRDAIGFVFQGYNLLPRIPAWMQVALPLGYQGISYEKKYQTAVQLLTKLGLKDKIEHRPDMLSGGEQQRVCIARALACNPKLILADEPTGALDSQTGQDLLKLFCELNKKGKTIVMITHDKHVASFAHKIIHLQDGLLVKDKK